MCFLGYCSKGIFSTFQLVDIFFKNRVEVKNYHFFAIGNFLDRPEVEILPDHFPWCSERKVSIFDRTSKVYWFEAPSHGNSSVFYHHIVAGMTRIPTFVVADYQ